MSRTLRSHWSKISTRGKPKYSFKESSNQSICAELTTYRIAPHPGYLTNAVFRAHQYHSLHVGIRLQLMELLFLEYNQLIKDY